jgi:hypothetical protein
MLVMLWYDWEVVRLVAVNVVDALEIGVCVRPQRISQKNGRYL